MGCVEIPGNNEMLTLGVQGITQGQQISIKIQLILHALAAAGLGESSAYRRWQYYWAFEYLVPDPSSASVPASPALHSPPSDP